MPRRALLQKRPWLLASLALALAYYLLKDRHVPGLYLYGVQLASFALLAVYCLLRCPSKDAKMLAGAAVFSGAGVVLVELDAYLGSVALILAYGLAIGVFLQRRRSALAATQKLTAAALLLLVPVIAWLLSANAAIALVSAIYGLSLGGMAAAAWASAFPRYRVGLGAILVVASSLISIAASSGLIASMIASLLAWPLFYLGHFVLFTGAIQTLRKDDFR